MSDGDYIPDDPAWRDPGISFRGQQSVVAASVDDVVVLTVL